MERATNAPAESRTPTPSITLTFISQLTYDSADPRPFCLSGSAGPIITHRGRAKSDARLLVVLGATDPHTPVAVWAYRDVKIVLSRHVTRPLNWVFSGQWDSITIGAGGWKARPPRPTLAAASGVLARAEVSITRARAHRNNNTRARPGCSTPESVQRALGSKASARRSSYGSYRPATHSLRIIRRSSRLSASGPTTSSKNRRISSDSASSPSIAGV